MNVLIVFNHPAPYKVKLFNELAKYCNLTVIFERSKAKDRDDKFYLSDKHNFNSIILQHSYIGREGSYSNDVKEFIAKQFHEYDFIIMNGYSQIAEIKAIHYMIKKRINYGIMVNGAVIRKRESYLKRKFKTHLISHASFYLSPTSKSSETLIYYGAKKENIYKYPYSNITIKDIQNIKMDSQPLKEKYNIPSDKNIFVNASQFIKRKNNFELIKVFQNLDDYLLLIGNGKEKNKYVKYITKNNIKNVIILPYQERESLFKIFRGCDGFITLAKEDIFGQTTIEALANGLPVISSNKINSSIEYIKDGYNGFVIDIEKDNNFKEIIAKTKDLQQKSIINSIKDITFENSAKTIFEILKSIKNYE